VVFSLAMFGPIQAWMQMLEKHILNHHVKYGGNGRGMVDAENTSDERASQLSFDISKKIEQEMQYPGQIKVTVIREMRSVSFAK